MASRAIVPAPFRALSTTIGRRSGDGDLLTHGTTRAVRSKERRKSDEAMLFSLDSQVCA